MDKELDPKLQEAIEMVIKKMEKESQDYAKKIRYKVWSGFDDDKPLHLH